MMNAPDSTLPEKTAQMVSRCNRFGSLSQPNSHSPRNVDSRKNAASPSHRQWRAEHVADQPRVRPQFIPNWNSCTIPVTTPIATFITSSVPKNLVSRRNHRARTGTTPSAATR